MQTTYFLSLKKTKNMSANKVDVFLKKTKKWQEEMTLLRKICMDCGLTEEFKWMHPCYSLNGKTLC